MLKGIEGDSNETEIEAELLNLKIDNVKFLKIKKINLKEFFHAKYGGNAFLVQVTSDSQSNKLFNVTRLANQVVRFERIRRKDGVQCHNCQRIGHVAKYCNREYRCVKCDQKHGPKECKYNNNENNSPYCVICKQIGHPASYRGCPKTKEIKEKIKNKLQTIKNKREEKLQQISNYINPSHTFADVTAGKIQTLPGNKPLQDVLDGEFQFQSQSPKMEGLENILNGFQKQIMTFMQSQLEEIQKKIQKNTEKLKIIFECIGIDD